MELVLPTPPAAGYKPGDDVTGLLKYDITSQEETIRDVRLDFDGRAVTTPFKLKFEAHRSIVTLVGQSRTLFHGPSTLKRQLLAWPFTFTIPTSTTVEGSEVPLPPSMDHRFREGVLVNVRYSITATVWSGSDSDCGRQQTRVLTVRPSTDLTTLRRRSYTLSFPTMTFLTHPEPEAPWSRLWGVFSCSEEVDFSAPRQQQVLHLELTLPSTLLLDQQESVTCRLMSGSTASESVFLSDPKFVIETVEFVLRSSLKWQDALQFQRHIGTTIRRPGTEIHVDEQSVSLAERFGLRDIVHHHHRETALPLLQSYDSVVPEVSLTFRLTATVVLKHEASGRILISSASVPVIVHGATTAADGLFPPAYSCREVLEEMSPPPYA